MKKTIVVLTVALMGWQGAAWGAVVWLKDGTSVRGTVVSATARDVQVQTSDGTKTFAADDIRSIDYTENEAPPNPAAPAEPSYQSRRRVERVVYDDDVLANHFSVQFGLASSLSRIGPSDTGGSSVRNGGTGVRIGVEFLHTVSPTLDLGVDVSFFDRGEVSTDGLVPFTESLTSGSTFAPLAIAKWGLGPRERRARPYVLAGIGPNLTSTQIDAQPLFGYVWDDTGTDEPRRLLDDGTWGLAGRAAIGIDFHPWAPSVAGFEIGWLGVFNPRISGTSAGKQVGLERVSGRLDMLTISGHWGWKF